MTFSAQAEKKLNEINELGFDNFPVCMAKTQYSFSTDATKKCAPENHIINVREIRLSAGAEFIVAIAGDIMTMPGLPKNLLHTKVCWEKMATLRDFLITVSYASRNFFCDYICTKFLLNKFSAV